MAASRHRTRGFRSTRMRRIGLVPSGVTGSSPSQSPACAPTCGGTQVRRFSVGRLWAVCARRGVQDPPSSTQPECPTMQSSSTPLPDVSVILPCAGHGTRFGAPYPKELHCLAPGVTVLDRSLEAVVELAKSGLQVRLVVVFGTHKLNTVSHLARYADTFQMVFVYQDESFGSGLDGAIRSALPMTQGPVALVLPDIVVTGPDTQGKLLDALRQVEVAGWSVVAAEERDHDTLRQMGALAVTETGGVLTVGAAADKPGNPSGFNAYWGMVAVTENEAHRLPDVVGRGTTNPLTGAVALMVQGIVNYNTPM
ncbi:NTP transferase domain-containing protein [Streptomyces ardesiacus]|uniref:NTP transferase domain-containing protein n=1 Tax=Streptomyces ardesiacus TaxID=285564 RepID=UPI003406D54E